MNNQELGPLLIDIFFIIAVPSAPISFNIKRKYLHISNIHVILEWTSNSSAGVVDYFNIFIQSELETDLIQNIQSLTWNVTLHYQINYKIMITAVNCAGSSSIKSINCK